MNDLELDYLYTPEIFFMGRKDFVNTYYLHVRVDLYIIVGTDSRRDNEDFGFMREVRLSNNKWLSPTSKREVQMHTEMDYIAFEMLVSGIMLHKGLI